MTRQNTSEETLIAAEWRYLRVLAEIAKDAESRHLGDKSPTDAFGAECDVTPLEIVTGSPDVTLDEQGNLTVTTSLTC